MSSSKLATPSNITKFVLLSCSFFDTLLGIGLPSSSPNEKPSCGFSSWIDYILSHTFFAIP